MSRRPLTTRQQQYDQQALDSLRSRFPAGALIEGSVVTLPVPKGTPPSKLTAASIRVSKGRDNMISPEIQWDSVMGYCAQRSLVPYRIFLDMHKTGREFEKRAVAQIVDEVKRGDYLNVVLWKWSRWGRNVRWSSVYLASVEEAGGSVRSASEDIDPKTAIGKFTRTQLLAIAELESDLKSEGWKATHDNRRSRDLPHTGNPRYGYAYSKTDGYTVVDDEAEILRELYTRFARGETMNSLTKWMNGQGHQTRTGNLWTPTALGRMLDTGFAAGLIRERSNPPQAKNNKQTIAQFDIWRTGAHEPIIPTDVWETYKQRRLANARKPRSIVAAKYTLTGMLICSQCGSGMHSVYSGRTNKHVWTCTRRQRDRAKGLESHAPVTRSNRKILAEIEAWLLLQQEGGEDIEERAARENAESAATANLENLRAGVASVKGERKALAKMKLKGEIDQEDYDEFKADIDTRLSTLEEALATAEREANARSAVPDAGFFQNLSLLWGAAEADEQRLLLERVSKGVVVFPFPTGRSSLVVPAWD